MNSALAIHSRQEHIRYLGLAAGALLVLPHVPFGAYLLYPFMILGTWFHEMGHGLAALLMGFDFQRLVLLPNGSGYAEYFFPPDSGRLAHATIAAAGPIGPAIVGSGLILASPHERLWKPVLLGLAACIALSTVVWVRSTVGWIVLPGISLLLVLIATRGRPWMERFALQFLGLQAALSMFQQWDYLLTEGAMIGGRPQLSDTGAIEQYLLLPHWIWASLIIAVAALMLGASLRYSLSEKRIPPRW
ncbi:M50 family metallopeptidase [Parerythrobacter aurantius]|uniref:M50 family metallopeptidase n=1 Tax=Parerythrobacter aurantius TaxID=3127706 RepID=UPI003249E958